MTIGFCARRLIVAANSRLRVDDPVAARNSFARPCRGRQITPIAGFSASGGDSGVGA
jgi:hypothetical protein